MAVPKPACRVKLARAAGTGGRSLFHDERRAAPAISVLLVEDDAPTLWRLQDALTKAGYQVRAAATLAEARACLAQGTPKVLLTDLQLPDGHGIDLIRETRRRFPDTEIMVISILGDEESVISAITVGATGYLLKDAFPTDIAATVRDLVAGHSPISASIARFIVRRTQSTRRTAARPAAQHRQTDAARDRHPLGHRQGFQLRRDRRPSRPVAADRARPHQEHLSQARSAYPRRSGVRGGAAGPDPAVNEDAATNALPGEVRRRLQVSRLLQYVLLQVLIAVACGFVLRQPLPAPPENYAVTEFRLREGGRENGSERAVTLPHFASALACRRSAGLRRPILPGRPKMRRAPGRSICRASPTPPRSRSTASWCWTQGAIPSPTGPTAPRRKSR